MVAPIAPSAHPLTKSGEHLAAAFARLAAKGAAEGVTVEYAHTGSIGTFIASSASEPGVRYCVVIDPRSKSYGCDCQGWERHRRCKHFALALEAAGWLPEPPEPEGGAPAPRIPIPVEPAEIDTAIQRIRDNHELARIAAAAVAERRAIGLIREDFPPIYDAPPRRPQPGDCPRCAGMAWDNCLTCCGSGFCPSCNGDGYWHTRDDELVTGPDGAHWICPDCAKFRDPIADAEALAELARNRMYLDGANVEPPERRGGGRRGGALTLMGWTMCEAVKRERRGQGDDADDAATLYRLRAKDEARWLANLRRQLKTDRPN